MDMPGSSMLLVVEHRQPIGCILHCPGDVLGILAPDRVRSDNRYHWPPRMGRSCSAIMTSGALALATTTGTLMSWAQSHLPARAVPPGCSWCLWGLR